MRIALFSHHWPGVRLSGIGTSVRQAAAALTAAGHEAHVFTPTLDAAARQNFPAGVIVHEVDTLAERVQSGMLAPILGATINTGGEGVYRLAVAWLLTSSFQEVHRETPFDLVEVPDVDALGLPLLLDSDRDLPVVVHLHLCTAIANAEHDDRFIDSERRLIEALEFAGIHLADSVCAPTHNVVDATRNFTPVERTPAIIPYFFQSGATPYFPPPAEAPILFLGRVERRKGCGIMGEALNIFLGRNPTAEFHFIGPDTGTAPAGQSMRRYILDAIHPAVSARVHMLGELDPAAVTDALARCSFVVLPSLQENFSLAVCEAMAAGRTVIVADGTGSVELVGDAGVVVHRESAVELARAMEGIYRDRVRLNELSLRSYQRIRTLCDHQAITRQRIEFYEQTIARFRAEKTDRLATLPPGLAGAILPALSRITGALTDTRIPRSQSPGVRLNDICGQIGAATPGIAVVLYGAGKHTSRLLADRHAWERHGHRVVGIIDDHPRFADHPLFLGLPVESVTAVESAARAGRKLPPVILSTDTYEDQFWENTAGLRKLGVPVFRLYGERQSA